MLRRKCLQLARQGFQAAKKTEASAAALSDQVRATSQSAREGRKALKRLQRVTLGSGMELIYAVKGNVECQQIAMIISTLTNVLQHRNSPDNNAETPFEFTDESYEIAAELMSHYPRNYKASAVIPLLTLAQNQNKGWLPLSAMNKVAEVLGMAPIRVYEVATFYTMFNRSKMGRYHIMVCGTTPCMLCGSRSIYQAIRDHLGIEYGQTTEDGYFTFSEMECMGACVNAPMICVADYTKGVDGFSYIYYEDLSPKDAITILEDLKAGKTPKRGSQYRNKAEPQGSVSSGEWKPLSQGDMTLKFEALGGNPPGPFCRNLDEPVPDPPAGSPAGPAPPAATSPAPQPPKNPPRG